MGSLPETSPRSGLRGIAWIAAVAMSAAGAGPAASQSQRIGAADLAVLMPAYVDGVIELRQFLSACAQEPANWEEGSALLMTSVKAAGLDEEQAPELARRLSLDAGAAATYDCASDAARHRLEYERPADWTTYHSKVLADLGIEALKPPAEDDPRLAGVRRAIAAHIADQSAMLNCMSLVETQWFPLAYADWNAALDRAAAAIRGAGYTEEAAEHAVGPARSAKLISPASDRQASIAACIADTGWMERYATFNWFLVVGDVETAVGARN